MKIDLGPVSDVNSDPEPGRDLAILLPPPRRRPFEEPTTRGARALLADLRAKAAAEKAKADEQEPKSE